MRDRRLVYVLLAVAALVALFIVLQQGNDNGESASATTATTASEPATETTATTTAPTTATVTAPQVTRWRIDSRDDSLDRLSVPKDTRLRIVAIADVSDHVHVHGYDLMADVAPGAPAVIAFTADAPGRFEIELEDRGRQIAQLNVRP
jgi:heme/copper-type cytochrome/quinol oxidase subunit 2